MGWAIRQPDGTYRCWNSRTQDDVIHPGEVWEERDTPPVLAISPPPPNPLVARIDAALLSTELPPTLRLLLAVWRTQL